MGSSCGQRKLLFEIDPCMHILYPLKSSSYIATTIFNFFGSTSDQDQKYQIAKCKDAEWWSGAYIWEHRISHACRFHSVGGEHKPNYIYIQSWGMHIILVTACKLKRPGAGARYLKIWTTGAWSFVICEKRDPDLPSWSSLSVENSIKLYILSKMDEETCMKLRYKIK